MALRIITIGILLLILSCSSDSISGKGAGEKSFKRKDINEVFDLKGEKWNFDKILMPKNITHTKDYLAISDRGTDPAIHILQKSNYKYMYSKGKKGLGPGEILDAWDFKRSTNENEIQVQSLQDKKLAFYNLQNDKELADSVLNVGQINTEIVYFELAQGNSIIAKPRTLKEKFIEFSREDGSIQNSWSTWENMVNVPETPNSVIASIFQGQIRTDKNRRYFGYGAIYSDFIEILDTKNGELIKIIGPDNIEHEFTVTSSLGYPMHKPSENSLTGYIDLYFGEKHIYGLYSGLSTWQGYAKEIYVFDYKGNPLKQFNLDYPTYRFSIDENEGKLYTTTVGEANPGLVVYSLPIN